AGTGGMHDEIGIELLDVDRAAGECEVVHRQIGRESHAEADVAELEIQVHDRRAHATLSECNREVRAGQRLPGATLRPEYGDQPPEIGTLRGGTALAAGKRLLNGELQL